jgi:hypothetical protein
VSAKVEPFGTLLYFVSGCFGCRINTSIALDMLYLCCVFAERKFEFCELFGMLLSLDTSLSCNIFGSSVGQIDFCLKLGI